jgi:uncharacterized protein YkwD
MRRWRPAVHLFAVLTLVAAALLPASSSGERRDTTWTEANDVSRGALLDAMNEQRARRGLPPLQRNGRLDAAAADRIRDMFQLGYFDHVAPDGREPFVWVRQHGYRYRTVGENLAMGQRAAREVVEQWMASPGHRANILGNFADTGIAIASGRPTGRGRGFTFVAVYGRPQDPPRVVWRR